MPRRTARYASSYQENNEEITNDENEGYAQDGRQLTGSANESTPEEKPRHVKATNSSSTKSKLLKVKKERVIMSRTRPPTSENNADLGLTAPFDRAEFLSTFHPIPSEGTRIIEGVSSDFKTVLDQLEHTGFQLVVDTAMAIEEVSGQTEDSQEANVKLDLVMRQLLDAQKYLQAHQGTLDSIRQNILSKEALHNLDDMYRSGVLEATETYDKLTTRQKYAKDEFYRKFKESVWEVNHEDAMGTLKDMLPREDDDSDSDSDIEVGGMTQNFKCPLTLRHLTDPMTSMLCNHSFSAEAIREYIDSGRGRNRCPATGCNQILTMNDLKPDEALARRAANALRRAQRREEQIEEGDAAEVIDD